MHMFRTNAANNNDGFIKRSNRVKCQNEECVSHVFITKKHKDFNPQAFSVADEFPKLPQSLDLVNQTVSIPTEPVSETYTYKNVIEYVPMNEQMQNDFYTALNKYNDLIAAQKARSDKLSFTVPEVITTATAFTEKKERFRGASDM